MLWGVGPKTAEKLVPLGVETIGQLAALPETQLAKRFGKIGWELSQRAKGIDDRPIVTERQAKSFSKETTYADDIRDGEILRDTLRKQSENVTKRLRQHDRSAKTINVKIRWPDFTTLTRQTTLDRPTADEEVILRTAIDLFEQEWSPGKPVRLLGWESATWKSNPVNWACGIPTSKGNGKFKRPSLFCENASVRT